MTNDAILKKINKNNKFIPLEILNDHIKLQCKTCGATEIKLIKQAYDIRCSCKHCYYERKKVMAGNYMKQCLLKYNRYELVSYNGKNERATLRCLKCGEIFQALPTNIKRNNVSCPNNNCLNNKSVINHNNGLSYHDIANEISFLSHNEYVLLPAQTPKICYDDKIFIKHVCGEICETTRRVFLHNTNQCKHCRELAKKNKLCEVAQKELDGIAPNRFIIEPSSYINKRSLSEIYDAELNETIYISICYLIQKITKNKKKFGRVASRTEEIISNILDQASVEYIRQKSFCDLKSEFNRPLYFDFYIPKFNLCIEFDGEFHYENIFGEAILSQQKHHDTMKNNYCKSKGILLLRIPYWCREKIPEIMDILLTSLEKGNKFITIKHKLQLGTFKKSSTTKQKAPEMDEDIV